MVAYPVCWFSGKIVKEIGSIVLTLSNIVAYNFDYSLQKTGTKLGLCILKMKFSFSPKYFCWGVLVNWITHLSINHLSPFATLHPGAQWVPVSKMALGRSVPHGVVNVRTLFVGKPTSYERNPSIFVKR